MRCPAPDCQQTIPVETVEELLIQIGMVTPDEEAQDPQPGG